jgi:hypothetical protein
MKISLQDARASLWAQTERTRESKLAQKGQQGAPTGDRVAASRFAGMLGLNANQLYTSPAGRVPPGAGQKAGLSASTIRQQAATNANSATATATAIPVPAVRIGVPSNSGLPVDRTDITVPAGTIVDGMVSAGPLSSGLASLNGPLPPLSGTRLLPVAADAASFNYDPIAMIQDRISRFGYSDGGAVYSRVTDTVPTPIGNRIYPYVRATWPDGTAADFPVERVLQNPDVAATEINSISSRTVRRS